MRAAACRAAQSATAILYIRLLKECHNTRSGSRGLREKGVGWSRTDLPCFACRVVRCSWRTACRSCSGCAAAAAWRERPRISTSSACLRAYPLAVAVGLTEFVGGLLLVAGASDALRSGRADRRHARRHLERASCQRLLHQLGDHAGPRPWHRVQPRDHRRAALPDADRPRRVVHRSSPRALGGIVRGRPGPPAPQACNSCPVTSHHGRPI